MDVKVLIAVILAVMIVPFVSAQNSTIAEAGNITEVNIIIRNITINWQGISGFVFFNTNTSAPSLFNATGRNVTAQDIVFQIDCDNPTSASGFILFSNSSDTPTPLVPGNLTQLDDFVGNGKDNGSNTFTQNTSFALPSGTVSGVPTTFMFVNESPQSTNFKEGYFNHLANLVFVTVIEEDLTGYNGSLFDYEILVPAPSFSTVPYTIFSDITFTCPGVAPPPGGGGGGGRRRPPSVITRPPAKPLPPIVQLPRIETVEDVLKYLSLILDPAKDFIMNAHEMTGLLINHNGLDIGDVRIEVILPELLVAPLPAHPFNMVFWNVIGGWKDHGEVEPEALEWAIEELPHFDWIPAASETPFSFKVTPPLMLPRVVDVSTAAYSGEVRIAQDIAQFDVLVPPYGVYAREKQPGVFAIYHVIDNRGNEGKSINIELALNRRRSTLVAEMLGPLRVPADQAVIFAHEYRLSDKALAADTIKSRAYGIGTSTFSLR